MIGGEHAKERFSERLAQSQNQPKNRGYLPGTQKRTGGYTTGTLLGNWSEERADAGFYDGVAVLPSHQSLQWTTTYRQMVGRPTCTSTSPLDQEALMAIVDHTKACYPGHQPQADPHCAETYADTFRTTYSTSFQSPRATAAATRITESPVLGGTPSAQATGVLQALRRQLLVFQPGRSAFPGNVIRSVRHALRDASTDDDGDAVNAPELLEGLEKAGLEVSMPACIALIRHFDDAGCGTASCEAIVTALRGPLSDHRQQLVAQVYALIEDLCADGVVRLSRVVSLMDVSQLGSDDVIAARAAFVEQWDAHHPDAYLSRAAFDRFFGDASFEISGEGDFELWMRNVWHLSGGSGASANTSCRRVEVVHLNGRVTHEEIKNDLGMVGNADDVEAQMRTNLSRQGIKDIKSMKILPPPSCATTVSRK